MLWSDSADTSVSTRLFYRYSGGPPTSADCVSMAATIYPLVSTNHDQWGPDTNLIGVKVTDLSSSTGGLGEHAQSTDGTRAGNELPAGTCLLVNYTIGRRYRGGKPRSYFPWFTSEDLSTRQLWEPSPISAVNALLATFFTAMLTVGSGSTDLTQHVNISYYDGFTVQTNPGTGRAKNVPTKRVTPLVDNIASFATSTRVASQRRRNGR